MRHAVAVVDARARLGRRDQAAQHRRDALRIDREFERRQRLVRRAVALAGLQLEQLVGIDGDGVGLDGGRGGDRAGDDLALHQQALHARVDQAGAELRQVEDADDQRDQAGEVEEDDAPGEAGEALRDEELPGAPRNGAQARASLGARRAAVGRAGSALRRESCPRFDRARSVSPGCALHSAVRSSNRSLPSMPIVMPLQSDRAAGCSLTSP